MSDKSTSVAVLERKLNRKKQMEHVIILAAAGIIVNLRSKISL